MAEDKVELIGNDLGDRDMLKGIGFWLLEQGGWKKVVFANPHGSDEVKRDFLQIAKPGKHPETLFVLFWAAVSTGCSMHYRKTVFGKETRSGGSEDGLEPSKGNGITTLFSPEQQAVAEFDESKPNVLYILFDLPHALSVARSEAQLEGILSLFLGEQQFGCVSKEHQRLMRNCLAAVRKKQAIKAEIKKVSAMLISRLKNKSWLEKQVNEARSWLEKVKQQCVKEYDQLKRETEVFMAGGRIYLPLADESSSGFVFFDFSGQDDYYGLALEDESIPFAKIGGSSAKAGLAQLIGRYQILAAFKLIKRRYSHDQNKKRAEEGEMGRKKSDPQVVIELYDAAYGKARPFLGKMSQQLGKSVFLHGTHCETHPVIDDSAIHVFPFCTPRCEMRTAGISRLMGVNFTGNYRQDTLKVERSDIEYLDGIALVDGEGIIFGEAQGVLSFNNFFIHLDAFHDWDENKEMVFSRMIDAYCEFFSNKKKIRELLRAKKEKMAKLEAEAKERYTNLCLERPKIELAEQEEALREAEDGIKELSKRLTDLTREWEALKNLPPPAMTNFRETLGAEFDRLASSPFVKKILVRDLNMEVHTKELILMGHKIGRFNITINVEDGTFHCYNLDRIVNGCHHHPHVCDGEACFGEISEEVSRLVGKQELATAIFRIWSRLKMYSGPGAYVELERWPEVTKRKRRRKEKNEE